MGQRMPGVPAGPIDGTYLAWMRDGGQVAESPRQRGPRALVRGGIPARSTYLPGSLLLEAGSYRPGLISSGGVRLVADDGATVGLVSPGEWIGFDGPLAEAGTPWDVVALICEGTPGQ